MSNQIRAIIEDKLSSYIEDNLTGVAVHKGVTDETRVLPIVIVHAASADRPSAFNTQPDGNYKVGIKVYIYTSADDESLQAHRDRVTAVTGLLDDTDAVKGLWTSSSTEGVLYDIWFESDNEGMQGRKYGSLLTYTAYAVLPTT